jgi:hypothetical protein
MTHFYEFTERRCISQSACFAKFLVWFHAGRILPRSGRAREPLAAVAVPLPEGERDEKEEGKMKTTKGGKAMNPTDAFRKEQRKKELKRASTSPTLGFRRSPRRLSVLSWGYIRFLVTMMTLGASLLGFVLVDYGYPGREWRLVRLIMAIPTKFVCFIVYYRGLKHHPVIRYGKCHIPLNHVELKILNAVQAPDK